MLPNLNSVFKFIFICFAVSQCGQPSEETQSHIQWHAQGPGNSAFNFDICSGKNYKNWDRSSTHAYFAGTAIQILKNDEREKYIGQSVEKVFQKLDYIAEMTNTPDYDHSDSCTFLGHFYNPKNGMNYLGDSSNTALNNFVKHAHAAVSLLHLSRSVESKGNQASAAEKSTQDLWAKELGSAIHYLEDGCQPFHAKNVIAFDPTAKLDHADYEHWVRDVQGRFPWAIANANLPYPQFTENFEQDIKEIFMACSHEAFQEFSNVVNSGTREETTGKILKKMQSRIAFFIERSLVEFDGKHYDEVKKRERRQKEVETMELDALHAEQQEIFAIRTGLNALSEDAARQKGEKIMTDSTQLLQLKAQVLEKAQKL